MYTVEKDKLKWELKDEVQLSAFLGSGWKLVKKQGKERIEKSS